MPAIHTHPGTHPPRAVQRARAKIQRPRENSRLLDTDGLLSTLVDAAWPTEISELADKIEREKYSGLRSFEQAVTDRDKQIILKNLPPCVQVQRDDPRFN